MTSINELNKRVWREEPWPEMCIIRLLAGEQIDGHTGALNAIDGAA